MSSAAGAVCMTRRKTWHTDSLGREQARRSRGRSGRLRAVADARKRLYGASRPDIAGSGVEHGAIPLCESASAMPERQRRNGGCSLASLSAHGGCVRSELYGYEVAAFLPAPEGGAGDFKLAHCLVAAEECFFFCRLPFRCDGTQLLEEFFFDGSSGINEIGGLDGDCYFRALFCQVYNVCFHLYFCVGSCVPECVFIGPRTVSTPGMKTADNSCFHFPTAKVERF